MLGGGDGEKGKMSERKISSICHSYIAWMTGEIVVPSKKMEIGKNRRKYGVRKGDFGF